MVQSSRSGFVVFVAVLASLVLTVVRAQEPPPIQGQVLECSSVLDGWYMWWGYHRDDFLGESERAGTGARRAGPSAAQRGEIAAALQRTLAAAEDPFLREACLKALARIGLDLPEMPLAGLLRQHLRDEHQRVREQAVLCLGIWDAADADDLALLVGLVRDDAVGRAARGGEVEDRCRCFASFSLAGLVFRHDEPVWQRPVLEVLRERLADEHSSPDLQVAAIWGLALMRPPTTAAGRAVHGEALAALTAFFTAPWATPLARANVPPAIARLLGRGHTAAPRCLRQWLDALGGGAASAVGDEALVAQALVLAIGSLAQPHEHDETLDDCHRRASARLRELQRTHPDRQTRFFALLGLGRIGGDGNRHVLLDGLASARDVQERGWCALALGLSVHGERGPGRAAAASIVGASLLDGFARSKPLDLDVFAVALGLSGTPSAVAALRTRLRESSHRIEDASVHLVHGLTLLGDAAAIPVMRAVLPDSMRRFALRMALLEALLRLGDDTILTDMVTELGSKDLLLPRTSVITQVFGRLGAAGAVAPLQQLLLDTNQLPLVRAFAAQALGWIAASEREPWQRALEAACHYRALTPTLSDLLDSW